MSRGGNAVSTGGMKSRRRMAAGGTMCGGMGQPPCGSYKRGGRTKPRPVKRYAHGGMHGGGSHIPQNQCRMLTSATDCHAAPGCHWNPSGPSCE